MGARGPQRDPNSRRGQAEQRQALALLDRSNNAAPGSTTDERRTSGGSLPTCPNGLPPRVAEIWESLLTDMLAAKIPVVSLDGETILQTARCLYTAERAEDMSEDPAIDTKTRLTAMSLQLKAITEAGKWLDRIGATPGARARIGIKAKQDRPQGAFAKILMEKTRQQ